MKKLKENHIGLIPIAIWVVLIPLIVKQKNYANPLVDYAWYSSEATLADFFLYYKSLFVTVTGILMALVLVWQIGKMRRKNTLLNTDSRMFIPIIVYIFLAIVSSLFSDYGYFCVHGMPDQFETIWNLIAYVIAMIYCYYVVVYQDSDKSIVRTLLVGAALVGLICVLQFFKIDIYRMIYAGEGYTFTFAEGTVYGPFYNINYVGFYVVLFVPLLVMLAVCSKDWKQRAVTVILTLALLLALYGAESIAAEGALAAVVVFAVFFVLIKNLKAHKVLWIPFAALIGCAAVACVLLAPYIKSYIQSTNTEGKDLECIYTNDENVEIHYKGQELYIQMTQTDSQLSFVLLDQNQEYVACDYLNSEDGYYYYTITDERFAGLRLTPAIVTDDPVTYGFMLTIGEKDWTFTDQMTEDGTYYYYTGPGKLTKLTSDNVSSDTEAFVAISSLANGRGYIWNKTLTLLKDYVVLGSGADTYAMVYPNDDYVDKYNNGYDNMILTKPHCLYLQIAVQSGVLSLLCFVIFYAWYLVSSLRLYFRQRLNTPLAAMGFAVLLGTLGYMISGLANDSTITVAPLYWAMMGLGIGINHRIRQAVKAE